MRLRIGVPIAATVIGLAIVATPLRDKLAGGIAEGASAPPTVPSVHARTGVFSPSLTTTSYSQAPPALTGGRSRAARSELARSPAVRHLLRGAAYRVVQQGIWTAPDNKTILGVMLILRLRKQALLSGAWPSANVSRYPTSGAGVAGWYTPRENTFAIKGVTELLADVNAASNAVVNIVPMNGALVRSGKRP